MREDCHYKIYLFSNTLQVHSTRIHKIKKYTWNICGVSTKKWSVSMSEANAPQTPASIISSFPNVFFVKDIIVNQEKTATKLWVKLSRRYRKMGWLAVDNMWNTSLSPVITITNSIRSNAIHVYIMTKTT